MSRKMTPFVFFITVLAILALACGGGGDVTCVPGDTICEQAVAEQEKAVGEEVIAEGLDIFFQNEDKPACHGIVC